MADSSSSTVPPPFIPDDLDAFIDREIQYHKELGVTGDLLWRVFRHDFALWRHVDFKRLSRHNLARLRKHLKQSGVYMQDGNIIEALIILMDSEPMKRPEPENQSQGPISNALSTSNKNSNAPNDTANGSANARKSPENSIEVGGQLETGNTTFGGGSHTNRYTQLPVSPQVSVLPQRYAPRAQADPLTSQAQVSPRNTPKSEPGMYDPAPAQASAIAPKEQTDSITTQAQVLPGNTPKVEPGMYGYPYASRSHLPPSRHSNPAKQPESVYARRRQYDDDDPSRDPFRDVYHQYAPPPPLTSQPLLPHDMQRSLASMRKAYSDHQYGGSDDILDAKLAIFCRMCWENNIPES